MRAERRRQLTVNKWCTHRTRRTRCWDLSRLPFREGAFATVYGMAPGNEREDRRDQRPARGAAAARGESCGGARRECQRAEGGRCGRRSLADRAPAVWSGERWAAAVAVQRGTGETTWALLGLWTGAGDLPLGKGRRFCEGRVSQAGRVLAGACCVRQWAASIVRSSRYRGRAILQRAVRRMFGAR